MVDSRLPSSAFALTSPNTFYIFGSYKAPVQMATLGDLGFLFKGSVTKHILFLLTFSPEFLSLFNVEY